MSCCESIIIPTTTYTQGRSMNGPDAFASGGTFELPEHATTVSSFALDRFEVTVGRFRNFVAAYSGPPALNAGQHPKVPFSGWNSGWDSLMPAKAADLIAAVKCSPEFATWTDAPGAGDNRPMNCINWYEAAAFCAWDGGRLPSEAEWECASAGGEEDRLYPWGSAPPMPSLASYYGLFDGLATASPADLPAVGSAPFGAGRWGHRDLAGSLGEWILDARDWYPPAAGPCVDCVNLVAGASGRINRGGSWNLFADELRSAWRGGTAPEGRYHYYGVRCVRDL